MATYLNNKEQISLINSSLIEMIKNPQLSIDDCAYFYHPEEKQSFIIFIYIFKLILNNPDYLKIKYEKYLRRYPNRTMFNLRLITNMRCDDELDLLLRVKEKAINLDYRYDSNNHNIIFQDNTRINANWLITFISLLLDNFKNKESNEISIYYAIPDKDITKAVASSEKERFLNSFTYYSIKVKHNQGKQLKENNILIVKNAAINYLKHLKQYKHGLENQDTYLIFYNLLKNECTKEGFELIESEKNLLDIDPIQLDKLSEFLDDSFYELTLSRQIHLIESIIWQLNNDITILEHMNICIDNLVDLLSVLNQSKKTSYADIRDKYMINDVQILLLLISAQFYLTFIDNKGNFDYSLLNLENLRPKYMNSICGRYETELKAKIKGLNFEITTTKNKLDAFKEERAALDSKNLEPDKYQKELEICVGNINRESILIARLNSNLSSLSKEYEVLKKKQKTEYRNIELYNRNYSIISHMINSIIGCSYYLKTNNTSSLLNNVIIFEDYEKTDSSFYLEISFRDLLRISKLNTVNGIIEQNDLPKLA